MQTIQIFRKYLNDDFPHQYVSLRKLIIFCWVKRKLGSLDLASALLQSRKTVALGARVEIEPHTSLPFSR